jgi:peroxiredoxin
MYAYLLTKFTNKYINPEYMGQDNVFVHLFTEYYLRGDTTVLDSKSRKTIIDRGYSMMLNQLGNIAPALDLTDTTGKIVSLYGIKSKFTLFAYWDPTCGHCRTELPVLDSFYRAKWKNEGVAVYSTISKDDLLPELKKFIKEKNLSSGWYYTYETKAAKEATEKAGLPNFRQGYDLNKTPIFYLLDADKRIIAKNLSIYQIDNLITSEIKKKKS